MLKIRRLNMDSTWQVQWDQTSLIIDPWLLGTEVEGWPWFNEQWHATPPMSIEDIGHYDGIIVSQSYSDHCHEETLDLMPEAPIYGTPKAFKRLRKSVADRLHLLPDLADGEWLQMGDVHVAFLDPGRKLDPVYYGIAIRQGEDVILYTPHGFEPTAEQRQQLTDYNIVLLITSFSLFRLPGWMGGDVNPGMDRARQLVEMLDPQKVVHTHDEEKNARGIVKKIARVIYPDYEQLKKDFPGRFIYLGEDYQYLTLSEPAPQG